MFGCSDLDVRLLCCPLAPCMNRTCVFYVGSAAKDFVEGSAMWCVEAHGRGLELNL